MRKIIVFILVALSLAACEKDSQPTTEKVDLESVVENNKVSLRQALLYAENSINGINPTTRSAERKVKSTEIYVAKSATRSAENTEVSFYLINYEDNEGFAMVSTDSRATPVYAYSDEGNLTPEDLETNPALQIFMDGSVEQYQIEVASYIDIYEPIIWPDSANRDILRLPIVEYNGGLYYEDYRMEEVIKPALLTTYWLQYSPYGNYCPNGVAGCGPIAAAQIMAYYKYPAKFNNHLYNWDAMTATSTLLSGTTGAANAATLIWDIGIDADAKYNEYENPEDNDTSTKIVDIKKTFRNFGYSCGHPASYDINRIMSNINAGKPLYIRGDNGGTSGHAWVIDGYHNQTFSVTYYYTYEPYDFYDSYVSSSRTYLHYNIGWGDNSSAQTHNNGYYLASNFMYNQDIEIIYDITPNQ